MRKIKGTVSLGYAGEYIEFGFTVPDNNREKETNEEGWGYDWQWGNKNLILSSLRKIPREVLNND